MRLGFFLDRIYFELETNAGQALAGFTVDSLLKIVSLQFLAWPFWPSSVMGRRFQHVWLNSMIGPPLIVSLSQLSDATSRPRVAVLSRKNFLRPVVLGSSLFF